MNPIKNGPSARPIRRLGMAGDVAMLAEQLLVHEFYQERPPRDIVRIFSSQFVGVSWLEADVPRVETAQA
jgi:hypothetical protein